MIISPPSSLADDGRLEDVVDWDFSEFRMSDALNRRFSPKASFELLRIAWELRDEGKPATTADVITVAKTDLKQ